MEKIKMPAGQYYIGAAHEVLEDLWEEIIDLYCDKEMGFSGKFTLSNGAEIVLFALNEPFTDHYCPNTDSELVLDTDVIICIESKYIKQIDENESGIIINLKNDFECYYDVHNVYHFGEISLEECIGDEYL